MGLLSILTALKEAPDVSRPDLAWAWRGLSDHIDRRHRLKGREHDDVRQRTLLKVIRAVQRLEAETEGQAEAWLRRVHYSARIDHHRSLGTKLMDEALRTTPKDARGDWLGRVAPPEMPAEAPRGDEEAALDAALEEVLDRVSAWLEGRVKKASKRQGDRLRAQTALLANVRGLDAAGIQAALGVDPPPSKASIYKWIERGREQVLLPALATWDHPVARALITHLEGCRRADAGKPRPARQKTVSRPKDAASSSSRKSE